MALKHDDIRGRSDFYKIDPTKIIVVAGWNERTDFGNLEELAQQILNSGLKIPLQVSRNSENNFELVDGERRLRAILLLIDRGIDFKAVACLLVDKKINPIDKLLTQLLCNGGKPFTAVEEANFYKRLCNAGLEVVDIAEKTGKNLTYIYQRIELGRATPEVVEALNKKEITLAEARSIATNSDSIESQSQQLSDKKKNGLKAKKGVFSFETVKKNMFKEFKKFKKTELHEPGERAKAITQLKELVKELENEEQKAPEAESNQISLLEETT